MIEVHNILECGIINFDRSLRLGRLYGRAVDHAEGGDMPEQAAEIHRLAQIGDLGLVDRALRHALGEELELADRAEQGQGAEIIGRGFDHAILVD